MSTDQYPSFEENQVTPSQNHQTQQFYNQIKVDQQRELQYYNFQQQQQQQVTQSQQKVYDIAIGIQTPGQYPQGNSQDIIEQQQQIYNQQQQQQQQDLSQDIQKEEEYKDMEKERIMNIPQKAFFDEKQLKKLQKKAKKDKDLLKFQEEIFLPKNLPVEPNSRKSQVLFCNFCSTVVRSQVRYEVGAGTNVAAGILFALTIIGAVIPYMMDDAKHAVHYCPKCQAKIGVKK